ncbi:hypothetical protein IWQ47_000043 [Aquimarina sp. EL_43]|uniref:hypothetical protein n=1 Tax=Aquimarina TaxID=290174 RepID=UPI0004B0D346|nr:MULTISPECIES: hypothetical protein [Aquimarina]MBG6129264.1 hypothetical protein [Aquimarina sp. EL_35]MBG6150329.1 hypothetical protein [Aquimarina sp. EL_32]MBG6166985.1 hypothetical protein [Aquimarina sp. EL_43]
MIVMIIGSMVVISIVTLVFLLSKIKPSPNCIFYENYILIKESPYSDELSDYEIIREEQELRFRTKEGYSLFIIKLNSKENQEVKLIGLASYGARNVEFNRYICNLVDQINTKTNTN